MVAEKKKCVGREFHSGLKATLQECADSCRGTSSMFAYGANDLGDNSCYSSYGCICICELAASDNGKCKQVGNPGYRLYKYESVNKGND